MPQKFLECEQSRDMEKREHSISIGSTFSPHIFSKKKKTIFLSAYCYSKHRLQCSKFSPKNSENPLIQIP